MLPEGVFVGVRAGTFRALEHLEPGVGRFVISQDSRTGEGFATVNALVGFGFALEKANLVGVQP